MKAFENILNQLAIVSDLPNQEWNAPTLNEALQELGLSAPILPGSIRGFATTTEFKTTYPERFNFISAALERTLQNPELQELLQRSNIGGRWIGPLQSTDIMDTNFEIFKNYSYLLELQR